MTTVKVRDSGWNVMDVFAELQGVRLQAGIFDDEEYATLALLHEDGGTRTNEDGSLRLPARPSMRPAFDAGENAYVEGIGDALMAACKPSAFEPLSEKLRRLAIKMAESHRRIIERGRAGGPALKASTVKRKGFRTKLLGKPKAGRVHMVDKIDGRVLPGGVTDAS